MRKLVNLSLIAFNVFMISSICSADVFHSSKLRNIPADDTRPNILFVGNSLTMWKGGLPEKLAQIAKANGLKCCIEEFTIGGRSLSQMLKEEELDTIIKMGLWDYIVLQGHSEEAVSSYPKFKGFRPAVLEFAKRIKTSNPKCKILLYATFPHVDKPETAEEIHRNYLDVGKEIGAIVVPCGPAWMKFAPTKEEPKKFNFLYEYERNPKDIKHPSTYGVLLNAYVFYGAIFGKHPSTLAADPALDGSDSKNDAKVVESLKVAADDVLIEVKILNAK